jgi:hypothetical protein
MSRALDAAARHLTRDAAGELVTPYGRINPSKQGFVIKNTNGSFTSLYYELGSGNKWRSVSNNHGSQAEAEKAIRGAWGLTPKVVSQ